MSIIIDFIRYWYSQNFPKKGEPKCVDCGYYYIFTTYKGQSIPSCRLPYHTIVGKKGCRDFVPRSLMEVKEKMEEARKE